jgi:RNA polymerase sigma-70 factor (ECF subfamily)
MGPAGEPIEAVFLEERGRLLALLAARFGDLDLAEEVTAEALLAAVETWPRSGVPREPLAWLATTARRKALDRIRRDATLATKLATLHADADPARRAEPVPPHGHIPDDRLQLMFACCHPALDLDTQTGLTLRYVAGLSTAQIAQAFLVPPATMAQRLTAGNARSRTAASPSACPARTSSTAVWAWFCTSSTSSSPRATRPPATTIWSVVIWWTRPSGSPVSSAD